MPRVHSLFRALDRGRPILDRSEREVLPDLGYAGCAHGVPGREQQALQLDRERLDLPKLLPGPIREKITEAGPNVNGLKEEETL